MINIINRKEVKVIRHHFNKIQPLLINKTLFNKFKVTSINYQLGNKEKINQLIKIKKVFLYQRIVLQKCKEITKLKKLKNNY